MSKTQKILLSCSAVCYVLVLFSFFNSALWMTLLFFILFTATLLYFSYLSWRSGADPDYEDELEILRAEYRRLTEENDELRDRLDSLSDEDEEEPYSADEPVRTESMEDSAGSDSSAAADDGEAEGRDDGDDGDGELPAKGNLPGLLSGMLPPLSAAEGDGEKVPVNIIRIVQDTVREFAPFSEKAGIHVQVSSPTDTILVKADVQRLRILFRNIIDNSIKYMNRAGNLIITLSMVGSDIFIVLKDNGDGLSESETPHIFEMNYQGSNRVSGNGLGLTQAKAIVDYYGGTIYARSKPGRGMGIYIQIPTD